MPAPATPHRPSPPFPGWAPWLLLIAAVPYLGTLGFPFVFDDLQGIVENPGLRTLWPPAATLAAEPDTTPWGRPMLAYSLALNHTISGLAPWSYRLANVILHLGNALLVFLLIRRLANTHSPHKPTAAPATPDADESVDGSRALWQNWLPLGAALLWAAHPLTTSAVTYVIQRAESLAAFFYLLVLYATTRFLESTSSTAAASRRWWVIAWGACAAGLLTKETVVTAPLLALLLWPAFFKNSPRSRRPLRILFFLGLFTCWGVLAVLMQIWPRDQSVGAIPGFGPLQSLLTQSEIIVHYLRQVLWPSGLALDHWWPARSRLAEVWPHFALLSLAALGTLALWRRSPHAGFVAASVFIILAPTSSFIPITSQLAADHRMYLPLAAVMVLLLLALTPWLERALRHSPRATLVAFAALLVALLGATTLRNQVYQSPERNWADVLAKQPKHARAMNNLGRIALRQGDGARAEALFSRAREVAPDYYDSYLNLAVLAGERGDHATAEKLLLRCIELVPGLAEAWANLGVVYIHKGEPARGRAMFEQSLKHSPLRAETHFALALLDYQEGRHEAALTRLERLLSRHPGHANAQRLYSAILQRYQGPLR